MPQIFQVLKCYKCLVFQVHQTKKSPKWECKLCGEKQSVKRHYGIGTAKDCRIHVQKLNLIRGDLDELKCDQLETNRKNEDNSSVELEADEVTPQPNVHSKWSDFVEESEPVEDDCKPMHLGDAEVVLEIPKKRKKCSSKNSQITNIGVFIPPANSHSTVVHSMFTRDNVIKPFYDTPEPESSASLNMEHCKVLHTDTLRENVIGKENFKPNVQQKKFIPPVINKNSKWVGYLDDEYLRPALPSGDVSQQNHMFSLCDDSELDNILNI